MTLSSAILILAVIIFALRGLRKGFFGALGGIVSLIAGYAAAIFICQPLAETIRANTSLDGLITFILAGTIAFAVASILTSIVFNLLERLMRSNQVLSGASRSGGLIVGGFVGGIIGLLLIYTVSIYQEFRQPDAVSNTSTLDQKTRQLASRAAATVLNHTYPQTTDLGTAFITEPVQMSRSVNNLLNDEQLRSLLQDPEYQQMLEQGDVHSLVQSSQFQHIAKNVDVQYLLSHSEIATDEDPELFLATRMSELWKTVQSRKDDKRIQAIINDPAFQQKLRDNDRWALINDPKMLELMELMYGTPDAVDKTNIQ